MLPFTSFNLSVGKFFAKNLPQEFIFTDETEAVYRTMMPFCNSPTTVASVYIIAVCGMKPLSLYTRILFLSSTSGKIGEPEISPKDN